MQYGVYPSAPEGFGMKRIFLLMPVLFAGGCQAILPDGKAPEGKITDNAPVQTAVTQEELENLASTSLCAYIMMHNFEQAVNAKDLPSAKVLSSISGITGVKNSRNAILRLEFKNGIFRLFSGKDIQLWQYPEK